MVQTWSCNKPWVHNNWSFHHATHGWRTPQTKICGSELMTQSANQDYCDLRTKVVTRALGLNHSLKYWVMLYGYICLAFIGDHWIWTNIQVIGSHDPNLEQKVNISTWIKSNPHIDICDISCDIKMLLAITIGMAPVWGVLVCFW